MRIDPKIYYGADWSMIRDERVERSLMQYWENDKDMSENHIKLSAVLLFNSEDPNFYLFTDNILENCHKLKITEKVVSEITSHLCSIAAKNDQGLDLCCNSCFLLRGAFYRWIIVKDLCYFVRLGINEKSGFIDYTCWRLSSDWIGELNPHVIELYQLLSFFIYSELQTIEVKPKKKVGTRKNGYYNPNANKITIVDSNWNVTSIRREGFDVNGHFRFQPYGLNNKKRKIVWIEPFRKKGYIRRAKKIET